MSFSDRIIERAQSSKRTIVLPEGNDARIVQGAAMASKAGIADVILLDRKSVV